MANSLKKSAAIVFSVTVLAQGVLFAAPKKEKKAAADKPEPVVAKAPAAKAEKRDKLIKWTKLETAFMQTQLKEQKLINFILQQRRKLNATKDAKEQEKIQKGIDKATNQLKILSGGMNILFAAQPLARNYVYNPVNSNVYMQIGSLQRVFSRAIAVRDRLAQFIGEQQALKDAEKDAKKKEEIDKKIKNGTIQYRRVAAALQVVFGVVPRRSYQYDPKSSTLYLKVSDSEIAKLKEQLKALQDKRAATASTAKKDATSAVKSAGKKDKAKKKK